MNLISSASLYILEDQLRPLHARVRDRKGELNDNDLDSSIARRFAFRKISAALSMQLQEIFLPCFSSLFFNVVKQSEWAVSTLMHSSSKASKHRR